MRLTFKSLTLLAVLMVSGFSLQGKIMTYSVKALGLNIASLTIQRLPTEGKLEVKTKSKITNALFPSIDNSYTVTHNSAYLPISYIRNVHQDKLIDKISTTYNHASAQATQSQSLNGAGITYAINPDTRDFFSFITMLSDGKAGAGTYELDANGSLWQVSAKYLGNKEIKTDAGKFAARGYKLSFSSATHEKPPYIDMVTHNLFHRSSKVELWVDGRGLVVKASMKRGAVGSNWELKSIRP